MGKVVTGAGLQEFIEKGTVTHVTDHKPKANGAVPLEVKKDTPVAELSPPKEAEKAPETVQTPPADENEGLEPDELEFSEQIRKKIGKKHRAMKEAQETAAEAERFAEQQFNERKLAEKRAEEAERRAKELEAKAAPPKPELKAPDIKDYTNEQGQTDWDKYTDAKSEYAAKKAVAEDREARAKEQAAQQQAQMEAQWRARLQVAETRYPDFLKVVGAAETWVPNAVLAYITESDYGADLTYYLAKNPDQAKELAKLSPTRAVARLGKLETQFEKPAKPAETAPAASKAPERGGAPPPITPISASGAGTVNLDPSKMGYKELRAYERARDMEKKRR
jgi:hypothetical protein